jgi:LmbE family N-acetylglucosaminyl deacetylase
MATNVMVVAHPDDETLWGWRAFDSGAWLVVCVTDCGPERQKKFNDAVRHFGATPLTIGLKDDPSRDFNQEERDLLIQELKALLQKDGVETVLTHGPEGEYGHPIHKSLSEIVTDLVPTTKLKYFAFQDDPPLTNQALLLKRTKALQTYFGHLGSATSYRTQEQTLKRETSSRVVFAMVRFAALLARILSHLLIWRRILSTSPTPQLERTDISDLIHTELSDFAVIRDSRESEAAIPSRVHLVLQDYTLYYQYHDRRYLALIHYPSCLGRTLSVGVHIFNKRDWMFMGNPEGFETLELEQTYAAFGSPTKHTTGDFLQFNPNYRFQDIVLFGVLGIPQDSSRDRDSYTLFDNETAVINKADQLLDIHGRIVVAPDLNLDKSRSRDRNVAYWTQFFKENQVLKERYFVEYQLETQQNLLMVFRRIS